MKLKIYFKEKFISVERKKGTYFPELDKVEEAIMNLEDIEAKEKALEILDLLIGRVRYAMHDEDYSEDGELKTRTNRFDSVLELFSGKLTLAMITKVFDGELFRIIKDLQDNVNITRNSLQKARELDPEFEINLFELVKKEVEKHTKIRVKS